MAAAVVAYPAASRPDRGLRRQRTPQLRTGWDDGRNLSAAHAQCDAEFAIACHFLQQAVLALFSESCGSRSEELPGAGASSVPKLYSSSPNPTEHTASRVQLQSHPPITISTPRAFSAKLPARPASTTEIDFSSADTIRTHGKKQKAKKAAATSAWGNEEEKKDEGTAGGSGDGDAGDGAGGASGGAGGAGGDDGKGGDDKGEDDWDDWSGKKKKDKKAKKKSDEEEEEEKKDAEPKDEWANVGGEGEWGGWGGTKDKKKTEDPAASTNAWADTGGGAEDEDWNGFTAGKKKTKNKKKQADDTAKPADDSFHEIKLDDELDLGVPKISLSFDDSAPAKKEEPASSGFSFGGWGSSWSFGGLGGKKDEDKDKNGEKSPPGSGGFWNKSNLSDFNFGFGSNTDTKSFDIGDSKKQADDEDDFLPAWGSGSAKDKKNKIGIEEVDDSAAAKKDDDTWGGWGKKTTTSSISKPTKKDTGDSWGGWSGGTTTSTKDKKKTGASWADLVEDDDEVSALPSIKDDKKADTWGMWGNKDKDSKKSADDDIWGGFESSKKDKKVVEELPDISILKGLACEKDGKILGSDGKAIGELIEGDAAIIARRMYLASDKGEFKDKRFKVVGKAKVLPKESSAPVDDFLSADAASGVPPLSELDGLCVERDGTIKSYAGEIVGKVTEGDAADFSSKMYFCDGKGNVVDYKGDSVGKCTTVAPGGAAAAEEPAKDEKSKDDDIWGWAANSKSKVPPPPKGAAKADKKKDEKKDDDMWGGWGSKKDKEEEAPAESSATELPDISILEGRTVDADGFVYDDDNVAIGKCEDGDIPTIARRKYKVNAVGEILSRLGKPLGTCVVLPRAGTSAPAAEEPVIEEEIPAEEEPAPAAEPPPLSALKGRYIEVDGTILNDDSEVIGEVIEGDSARMASVSAKCDDKGNVIGAKKKVIGKCQTVAPRSNPVTEAPSEAPAEETPAEEEKPTAVTGPTFADLMGRKIETNGDVLDDDLNVIAKVIDGNAKQLAKKGAICDAEGNVVLGKKTLGKVELVMPDPPAEPEPPAVDDPPAPVEDEVPEPPKTKGITLASLEGKQIQLNGDVLDDDGNVVAKVVDGKPKMMVKKFATCDAHGNVVFGFNTMGRVELVVPEVTDDAPPEAEDPPPAEDPPAEEAKPEEEVKEEPTLAILEGRPIEKSGDILNDEGEVIGRLVAGSASKLYKGGATCDAEGGVIMKKKIQKDASVELVLPEKPQEEIPPPEEEPAAPEPPPVEEVNPLAKLDGRPIEKNGDILDDNGDLIAILKTGSATKLNKAGAKCDGEGNVVSKGKVVKDATVELIEPEKKEDEPPTEEEPPPPPEPVEDPPAPDEPPFAKLDGRKMEKNGDILDDDGNVLAMVSGVPSLSKLYKAGATCTAEGKIMSKGKEVKDAKVELIEVPEPEEPAPEPEPEKEAEPDPVPEALAAMAPPTWASIEGKMIDKFGEIYNDDNILVARLCEGSAALLYKKGAYCDGEGNLIIGSKKSKTGKLELVVLEDAPEPEPEAAAEPEPEPTPDPPAEEDKAPEDEPLTLASLEGYPIQENGDVYNDKDVLIGRLVEGNAAKLYAKYAECGLDGKVKAGGKTQKSARVELVQPEKAADPEPEPEPEPPAEPEPEPEAVPEPPSLAILDGKSIDKSGNIYDDDMNVIGTLVEGDPKKLAKAGATCDAEGNVIAKKKKVSGARVELVEQEKPADPEPEPEPEAEAPPPPPPPPPAPKEITLADLEGREFDEDGNVRDDDGVIIGKMIGETKKLKAVLQAGGVCTADGKVSAKKKIVPKVSVEVVQPEPPAPEPEVAAEPEPEPEAEPEPEPEPESTGVTLADLDGRPIDKDGNVVDDNGVVIGKLVEGLDKLKLAVKGKATCDGDGNLVAKGKVVPRCKVEIVQPPKPEAKDPVKDLLDSLDNPDDAWGDPWDKKNDDKALTRITTKSSKASKDDDWDDWTGSKKDKKKKKDEDPRLMKAEAVDEPDASKKEEDSFGFAFTNKRDKKTKKKDLVEAVEDDDAPMQKAEVVEEQKSSQEDSDWAFASNRVKAKKAAAKAGPKTSSKSLDAVKAIEAAPEEPEDDDELAPDDSASVTKDPPPVVDKKKEEKPKASSMWGSFFGGKSTPKPTAAQLKKEREEREAKDREEREKQEQQEREEAERVERERIEAEQAEQERIEKEEREKALKEAEEAEKSRKLTKKSKKSSSKSKAEEPLPPPPPPPPPAPIEEPEPEPEADEPKDDPFAIWGVKRKPLKSANEKSSAKSDAKKALETPGDEVLPIVNTKSGATASSSKSGIKVSSKSKTGSIADRIKALQGETKLEEDEAQTPPVPPPPPAVPPPVVESKESSKKSKKSSKSASRALAPEPEVVAPPPPPPPEPVKKKNSFPGGFPDSDNEDDLLIDLAPTPPPEPDMGASAGITKSSKKSSKSTKVSKTSSKTKAKPAVVEKADSGSETEAEPEENDNAVTQGSGSTTAVDDQNAAEGKLPTPPPEPEKRKSSSPTTRRERPKVVRGSTGAAWGFWGTSGAPKDARSKAKDSASTKAAAPPAMVRQRTTSRKSNATDPDKSEGEKKATTKPTPKRASTFSIFSPAPPRRQSTRSTPKPSSKPPSRQQSMSRRASPEMPPGDLDDDDDEVPRVSSKAAKVMGLNASAGASTTRRKSKGKVPEISPHGASPARSTQHQDVVDTQQTGPRDPYAIDDDDDEQDEMPDNGLDMYAVDAPAAPAGDRRRKRRSVADPSALTQDDEDPLVDADPSLEGARAIDPQDQPSTSRRQSPSKRRSISRSVPRKEAVATAAAVGGIMGLFGLKRSNTTKETPRGSDPSFGGARSRRDGYDTDAGYRRSSKPSADGLDDDYERRDRRQRRKSRRNGDEDGFTTDAPAAQTDYEDAERRRAERKAARRAEKDRQAEETRVPEDRDARKRDRTADKEARRAARRERDEARIAEEVERRHRAEKEERRAARKAREEDRTRQEVPMRPDEAIAAKEERRQRRREREREREMRAADPDRADRPRGEKRRSSYMDGGEDLQRHTSRRESRRTSRAQGADDYFDPRNGGKAAATTPYLGSGGDKTSSWVDSVNREPPMPLAPEDTATVLEPPPEDILEDEAESDEEEIRRRMHGRREKRSKRDSHMEPDELPRERERERDRDRGGDRERDRDRDDRRRERRRRDRERDQQGEKTSDTANERERERRRRSSYYPTEQQQQQPVMNDYYNDYAAPMERPVNSKRTSWLKKIPLNQLF